MKKYIVLGLLLLTSSILTHAVEYPQQGFQSVNAQINTNSTFSSSVSSQATVQEYYNYASAPSYSAGPAKAPGAFPPSIVLPDAPKPEDKVTPIGEVPMLLLALLAAAFAFARKRKEEASLTKE